MACLSPKIAFYDTRVSPARVLFKPPSVVERFWSDALPDGVSTIALPCGKCFACRLSRCLDVTVRAVAESRMHEFSSFITLTASDSNLSDVFPNGLCHRPFQLFAKRLRKRIGKFTFLMCGEYGSQTLRPHYHVVVFGHRFVDGFIRDNCWIASRVLSECWPFGNITVDDVNINRLAYVAGYVAKDGFRDDKFWSDRGLGRPYVKWSRRPSLGLRWFLAFKDDLIDEHYQLSFVLNGKSFNFGGRYFLQKIRLTNPDLFDKISSTRRKSCLCVDAETGIMRHEELKRKCELKHHNQKTKKTERYL